MKVTDMHKKSKADLEQHALNLKDSLANTRQELHTKGNTNHREVRKIRKEIAQTMTIAHLKVNEKKTAKADKSDEASADSDKEKK